VNVAKHRGVRNKTRVRIEKSELIRLVSEILLFMYCRVVSATANKVLNGSHGLAGFYCYVHLNL
jgi:hypothetical protein